MFLPCESKYYSKEGQNRVTYSKRWRMSWVPMLSFSALLLIWLWGSLDKGEKQMCRYFCLFVFSCSCWYLFFFLVFLPVIFPGCFRKWKPAFCVPPEATKPLQNIHFPINKYIETTSQQSLRVTHTVQTNTTSMETKSPWEVCAWWSYAITYWWTILSRHADSLGR